MKQPERVAELLAELRALSENDFERHRLDVLERDLTAPPTVEVIDDTHQRFNGVTYRATPQGHHKVNSFIHRQVFSYYHGEIPEGYEIHHVDHNKANNDIHNLQMLTKSEHKKTHWQDTTYETKHVCEFCGKAFLSRCTYDTVRFCSQSCRNAWNEQHGREETRICVVCGKTFIVKGRAKARCCSRSCANRLAWQSRHQHENGRIEKVCAICSQKFITPAGHPETMCCSKECKRALIRANRKLYFQNRTADNSLDL